MKLILKEPNSFGIHPETSEGREIYRKAEMKHWRRKHEETHEPTLILPENEVKWLEEAGRIHVLKRISQENPKLCTSRNGKDVECVTVRVASWTEAHRAYKIAWAKFQLSKH